MSTVGDSNAFDEIRKLMSDRDSLSKMNNDILELEDLAIENSKSNFHIGKKKSSTMASSNDSQVTEKDLENFLQKWIQKKLPDIVKKIIDQELKLAIEKYKK